MQVRPGTTDRFYGLDHLRALAITLVFFYHYSAYIFGHPGWLDEYAKFGWTGVDLFFVLSGFLISSHLFSQWKETGNIKIKEFYLKRSFRILPAFLVVVAIYFCFPGFHEREQLRPLYRYLTFTQNFGLDVVRFGTFSHAWSLCVEEHFYLVLPFALLALGSLRFFKNGYWLLLLLFAATIYLRYHAFSTFYEPVSHADGGGIVWYTYIYYPSYCRLDGLLIGVGIAAVFVFLPALWNSITKYGNLLLLLSLAVLTGGYFLCYDEHSFYASVWGFSVVSVGYGLMVMSALSQSCFLYKWRSRVTSIIALLSYGVYLVHKGVIHITQDWLASNDIDVNSGKSMIVCTGACLIAAGLLHISVERPFMLLRKKILCK